MKRFEIRYYSVEVQQEILAFPATIQARYIRYTDRMREFGANLGMPHTEAFGDGLFELRLKGAEGLPAFFTARRLGGKSSCCTVL